MQAAESWMHGAGPCLLCKGAQDEEEFDYCRACGFTVLPFNEQEEEG